MSRYVCVALLCAVALFVMAPTGTALADENAQYVPPPNPVTDLYDHLITGMSADELTELAAKCVAEREPNPMVKTCDDGIREYWVYSWKAKSREDACSVELTVTVTKKDPTDAGKVSGTMYKAQQGDTQSAAPAKDGVVGVENPASWTDVEKTIDAAIAEHTRLSQQPHWVGQSLPAFISSKLEEKGLLNREPENPCRELFNELKLGMTVNEFEELAVKHGFKHKVQNEGSDKDSWGAVWWKYHKDDPAPPPQDTWQWQTEINVEFSDGRVVKAEYTPLTHRPEEKK